MARITVEDCLGKVDNRFELVMVAAQRARQLATTPIEPMVEWENDKPTVVALREIAAGHISKENVNQLSYVAVSTADEPSADEPLEDEPSAAEPSADEQPEDEPPTAA